MLASVAGDRFPRALVFQECADRRENFLVSRWEHWRASFAAMSQISGVRAKLRLR